MRQLLPVAVLGCLDCLLLAEWKIAERAVYWLAVFVTKHRGAIGWGILICTAVLFAQFVLAVFLGKFVKVGMGSNDNE